jgi:hypothetical protein
VTLPQGEILITKGVHRTGLRGYVDLVVTPLAQPDQIVSESVPLLGFRAEELGQMAIRAGAAKNEFFGGYRQQPYDEHESIDLIMVAER